MDRMTDCQIGLRGTSGLGPELSSYKKGLRCILNRKGWLFSS